MQVKHIYSLLRLSLFISYITDCCHYNTTFQLFLITCVCVCVFTDAQLIELKQQGENHVCFILTDHIRSVRRKEEFLFHTSLSVCVSVAQMSQCALVSVFPEALSLSVDTIACSALTSCKDQGMCAAHISYMYCNTYLQQNILLLLHV